MVGNRDLKILCNESEVSNQGSVLNFEMVGQADPNPAEGPNATGKAEGKPKGNGEAK